MRFRRPRGSARRGHERGWRWWSPLGTSVPPRLLQRVSPAPQVGVAPAEEEREEWLPRGALGHGLGGGDQRRPGSGRWAPGDGPRGASAGAASPATAEFHPLPERTGVDSTARARAGGAPGSGTPPCPPSTCPSLLPALEFGPSSSPMTEGCVRLWGVGTLDCWCGEGWDIHILGRHLPARTFLGLGGPGVLTQL